MTDNNITTLNEVKPQSEVDEDTVKYLRDLLAQAEAGQVRGLAVVYWKPESYDMTYVLSSVGNVRLLTMLGGVAMLDGDIRRKLLDS